VANASRRILALAAADSTVYAGGGFSSIGGEPRLGIAALDARTGAVRDWYPGSEGIVWSLTASHDMIYAGGAFRYMGNWPQAGFAAITPADEPGSGPIPPTLALGQNAPNPASQSTVIRYSLPAAATVSLALFDLQGRRVATLLSNAPQAAGPHEVSLNTGGVGPGLYLFRLEAGGRFATRKMVVVR
jgi:hypothetical protein